MSMYLNCKFIDRAATTAYQKGCRCARCTQHHEEITKEKKKQRAIKSREFLLSLKLSCVDCGWNTEPSILEFHHEINTQNDTNVGSLIASGCSIERLLEEIDKGSFLCPTCHKLRHFNKDTKRVETFNEDLR